MNTMKTITTEGNNLYSVVSEPGDATRYDYFVYHDYDDFCFMPRGSTFRFPQRLNCWETKDLSGDEIFEIAKRENCNVFTLKECMRTIVSLSEVER